jgi:CRP-like cAMP-binding protein
VSLQKFIDRLRKHSDLSEGDVARLNSLGSASRQLAPGAFSVRDGATPSTCSLLVSGIAAGHKIVGSGGRQIVGMFFAGELLDFDALFLPSIDYNVQAISECKLYNFECEELVQVMFECPSIGKALFRDTLIKSAISREWMANLGRRDSRTKVAYLLCELSVRLSHSQETELHDFVLPLTQEQISDIIGVTPMHVSRVLKELETDGLIARERRVIRVLDWTMLASAGDFSPTYLRLTRDNPAAGV